MDYVSFKYLNTSLNKKISQIIIRLLILWCFFDKVYLCRYCCNVVLSTMSKAVLLVNLGSPDSPNVKDVKRYLDEFLMDKRVIDTPYLIRAFVVKGIILNTRPKKSSRAYRKIWWDKGSPLIVLSKRLRDKVSKRSKLPVYLAMRYGNPSIESVLEQISQDGIKELLLVPLYPQYAMATTQTITALVDRLVKKRFNNLSIDTVPPFYQDQHYIDALVDSIKEVSDANQIDHFLFSYHGVPERHIKKTDVTKSHCKIDKSCCQTPSEAHHFCYRHQCYQTTKLVVSKMNLADHQYSVSFQSRLGKDPWLQPYTDQTVVDLAKKGVKNLAVITPAFVSDCLETLEEIAIEAAAEFKQYGGDDFISIPCLNDRELWVETIANWISRWDNSQPILSSKE